jgi:cysteine synthase
MTVLPSVLDAIGNTPLIRLRRASEATGCEILGKAEFMNPGQSVKDRAALSIIRDAEATGLLRPGGRIVEGTAGNTGIGLAMVASALGYKTTIVIPRTQSQEKKDAIRLLGAELVEVDAVPYSNPGNYVRYSGRLAEELAASDPTASSGPTSSTMSPTARPTTSRPGRKSLIRQAARSMASSAPSARAAPWPASRRRFASASPR